jgi:fructokinase
MGEVLIDFLPIDEQGQTVGFRMHPGGSLLNVAVAIARLGHPVAMATKIATDFFGAYLREFVANEGIDTRWLIDEDALSTLAFVAQRDGEPVFTFYGEGTADTLLTPAELPPALLAETSILHIGSISLLRGTTPAAIVAAVEGLKGRALISLDPNLRPAMVKDEPAYRALLAHLFGLADLVKISAADLGWLMPGMALADAARALLAHGPALVAVTSGGSGALAVRAADQGEQPFTVPAYAVKVADTVGAGDSFNGGLLTRLAELGAASRQGLERLADAEVAEALRFAAAVAALNVTRPGADPPRREAVTAFMAQG